MRLGRNLNRLESRGQGRKVPLLCLVREKGKEREEEIWNYG